MILLRAVIVFFSLFINNAYSYEYNIIKKNNHVIHRVTLNPKDYHVNIVKAEKKLFGRETLSILAKDANIAINGGFFSTDKSLPIRPNGTLIIDGAIFTLNFGLHSCFIIDKNNRVKIDNIDIDSDVIINNNIFTINAINPINQKDLIFYSYTWEGKTPESYDRNEILIRDSKIFSIYPKGNNNINFNEYILSIPKTKNISNVKLNDEVKIMSDIFSKDKISAVRGIPMLVYNGKLTDAVLNHTSKFYTHHHARTAIGIKENGDLVLVVVENDYTVDLVNSSFDQIKAYLQKYHTDITNQYVENFIYKINKSHSTSAVKGLPLKNLAELMIELGCNFAINMDGGGSSGLFIDGVIMNKTIGDEDEDFGFTVERSISDAITFTLKDKGK